MGCVEWWCVCASWIKDVGVLGGWIKDRGVWLSVLYLVDLVYVFVALVVTFFVACYYVFIGFFSPYAALGFTHFLFISLSNSPLSLRCLHSLICSSRCPVILMYVPGVLCPQ